MMRRIVAMVAGAILLTACGSDSTAPTITMTGNWSGTVSNRGSMFLHLSESGGIVTGDGAIGNTPVTVHGTHTQNSTSFLDLSIPGGSTSTFNVEVLLPSAMSGTLHGGAWDGEVAILDRK